MTKMTVANVVERLIGHIDPVGETHIDTKRFASLEELITLVDSLIGGIVSVAEGKTSHLASVRKAGVCAQMFLDDLYDCLEEQKGAADE